MSADDRNNKSGRLPQNAADFRSRPVFTATLLILGMALLSTICIYVSSDLIPTIGRYHHDQAYWLLQAYALTSYGIVAFSAVISGTVADRITQRYSFFTLGWRLATVGISMAAAIGLTLYFLIVPMLLFTLGVAWTTPVAVWVTNSLLAPAGYAVLLAHRDGITQREQALRVLLNTEALGTFLDRAELSMLEAQIEPHFLFNTLAHVKRHYRIEPVTADKMLIALIDYLNRALPALRRADWTVGDELALIRAYLDILIDRFGTRLRFIVTASDESLRAQLPALTVATLVENAVRHGITPQIEGGTISVVVAVDATALRIEVRDDGAGLKAATTTGSGLGLITARARLRNAFGPQAGLTIEQLNPKGVRASISIPLRT
jgi:sensor histidine kinase YesM